jgi:rod shape-determining protein MreC
MASPRTTFTLSARHAPRGTRRLILLATVLGCIAAGVKIAATLQDRTSALDRGLVHASAPLSQSAIRGTSGFASLGEVFHLGRILRENEELKQQKVYLEGRIAQLEHLKSQNDSLRQQLRLKPAKGFRTVGATVIARPFDPWLETVVLDTGSEAGIKPGCLVTSSEGIAGKVSEAAPGYSKVELVASPRFRLSGITLPGNIEGVVRGVSSSELAFDYVEARAKIAVGDNVYSRAHDAVAEGLGFTGSPATPGGLLIGRVVEMSTDQDFLRLKLEPAAHTNSLQTLMVHVP